MNPSIEVQITARLDKLDAGLKVAEAKIRWVLASDEGYVIRNDVPASLVERAAAAMLAGSK